ncbi:ABC transporter ATP-binding protein [Brevibacillus fluminis]|uniref:ABC transporter ATP-binding protein n=1 Tax=Brevibacillus fluminis TaxID=511487 RepID=A0A3M8CU26_9BACL|nr:ABC transporter ATP-binding protein [Brevibacillus fluminis]RNB79234.1 ABC transporter ATP-binding protein [Brevibacillus fluminis]
MPSGLGRPGFARAGRGGPVQKPKNLKGTLKRLWLYIGTEKRWLSVIFGVILIDSVLTLFGPYLIGLAVDAIGGKAGHVQFGLLHMLLIGLACVYVGDAILTFGQGWMMAGVSQRIVAKLRYALYTKLQKLPLSYFDTHRHGEVMSRLSNDIDNVSQTLSQATAQLMSGVVAIGGSLAMMIWLSPLLTLASLITVPLVMLLARTITKRTSILFKEQQVQLGQLNGHVEETISGMEMVKAFNHEQKAIHEFEEVNEKLYRVGVKAQIWSGFLMPIMGVINNIGFAAIALAGGAMAANGMITVGVIASFISYSRQFVRPLNDIANIYNVLQSGVAGAERVFEVIDESEETEDAPDAKEMSEPKGEVVFDRVSFGYRPEAPILKNISFVAREGTSTAFVGPTGAGKTTIINLLTRFYDVTEGRITIDGEDIRRYSRDSLRKGFGIVLQDTYLFSGTIKENIKYGRQDATDEEVEAAAVLANADAFIKRLPRKYDTMLSENGGNLSQGQRQLLASARVMLAQPSILILDEATSSIDTRTEVHIQEALLRMMQGRTSFIIAHRLNTIREADTIMVIDGGEIVEQGSHEQLMAQKGIYYDMFYKQLQQTERKAAT